MTKDDVIRYFGSQAAVAAVLSIKPPSVAEWGERPPALRQLQLEVLTGGALVASADCRPAAAERQGVEPANHAAVAAATPEPV